MNRPVSDDEFGTLLRTYRHTAFRLELQDAYAEPDEAEMFARFLATGDPGPETMPGFPEWCEQVAAQTLAGKQIGRVRVHSDPPTDYQRFERYVDRWNIAAGETMRYLTRQRAHEIGLLPAAGNTDWWLLDSERLILMEFDEEHHRIRNTLTDDPEAVRQACAWRDLAVRNASLGQVAGE